MTDARLDRTADGCCTLFVGHMLVFSDLTEAQARDLMQAFGSTLPAERTPRPTAASVMPSDRSVGGRSGRTLPRTPTQAAEQALARLR